MVKYLYYRWIFFFMKICLHGAAQEIGRSCLVINGTILLDCGIRISKHEQIEFHQFDSGSYFEQYGYPSTLKYHDIAVVFLSHGHLDHSGALPLFNKNGMISPIYCTAATKKICELLMQDALKLAHKRHEEFYTEENIVNVLRNMKIVDYKQ